MNGKDKSKLFIIFKIFILILSLGYFIYSLFFIKNGQLFNIINSFLFVFIAIMLLLQEFYKKKIYKIAYLFVFSIMIGVNMLNNFNLFTKVVIGLEDLTNKSIAEVLKWADENNITIEQIYEYSDNINEFNIISQNVSVNTPIEEIEILKLVVSSGPNYDKVVIIPNLVGSNIDELLKIKKELLLNNVVINYVKSDLEKNTIISQSVKGQYSRKTEIVFEVSLGNELLEEIEMIDLTNKDLFDATLWLKQNGINYDLVYEFSDKKRNIIISHNPDKGNILNINNDKISIVVSKGESITVPNILDMTSDEVINWISDNNLKIEFTEVYDTTTPLGKIISCNYNEGDIIEDGTLIKITTSKGQLKFPKVNSLQELKNWANSYNINVNESYEMSNSVGKGNIISTNYNEGDVVDPNNIISIVISSGNPITVPNFYNMNKNDIVNKCNSLGLICTFYEGSYSNIAHNHAINQSVGASAIVTSGKTISIALSKGPAKSFTVKISSATINSCIGDSNCTIGRLREYFNTNYPGVKFNFTTATSSTFSNAGFIHESSQVTDGTTVTQGNTYNVIITK